MLALVAGRGALPAAVARAQQTAPLICALADHNPDGLTPDVVFRMEELSSFLTLLAAHGVTDVCLCGAIQRPEIDATQVELDTQPLLPVLNAALASGEDSALRAIIRIFEKSGFNVLGAHELAPDLLPAAGVLTSNSVPETAKSGVYLAQSVLKEQAQADLGQSCVIQDGTVVAREGPNGTDVMLSGFIETGCQRRIDPIVPEPFGLALQTANRAGVSVAENRQAQAVVHGNSAEGGFLFKASKPGQDLRVDLPTVGPMTAICAAEAGLDGIIIEADRVMVIDLDQTLSILNAMGMYLWVR